MPVASALGYVAEAFRHDPKEYNVFWDARKGLIPIVGGAREVGTSMLLEDVACSTEKLGEMSKDLIGIFKKWVLGLTLYIYTYIYIYLYTCILS